MVPTFLTFIYLSTQNLKHVIGMSKISVFLMMNLFHKREYMYITARLMNDFKDSFKISANLGCFFDTSVVVLSWFFIEIKRRSFNSGEKHQNHTKIFGTLAMLGYQGSDEYLVRYRCLFSLFEQFTIL